MANQVRFFLLLGKPVGFFLETALKARSPLFESIVDIVSDNVREHLIDY